MSGIYETLERKAVLVSDPSQQDQHQVIYALFENVNASETQISLRHGFILGMPPNGHIEDILSGGYPESQYTEVFGKFEQYILPTDGTKIIPHKLDPNKYSSKSVRENISLVNELCER